MGATDSAKVGPGEAFDVGPLGIRVGVSEPEIVAAALRPAAGHRYVAYRLLLPARWGAGYT